MHLSCNIRHIVEIESFFSGCQGNPLSDLVPRVFSVFLSSVAVVLLCCSGFGELRPGVVQQVGALELSLHTVVFLKHLSVKPFLGAS